MSRYDSRNKLIFGCRRKNVSVEADWTSSDRQLQSRGPAVENERTPIATAVKGGRHVTLKQTHVGPTTLPGSLKCSSLPGSRLSLKMSSISLSHGLPVRKVHERWSTVGHSNTLGRQHDLSVAGGSNHPLTVWKSTASGVPSVSFLGYKFNWILAGHSLWYQ